MDRDWWVPLLGLAFVVVTLVSFAVGGEPPEVKDGAAKVVEHYVDNKDAIMVGGALAGIAASLLLFFAAYLRKVLRAAEGEGGVLSILAVVGAGVFATGIAIDATISFALAESADDLAPAGAQALQALWENDFMPMAVGLQVLLLSTGLSIVRHGALPKWLGWIAILLAIVAVTPAGFAAFIGSALWFAILSVMLTMRARSATA